jgi:exodeoxyribonuclease-1
MRYSTKAAVVDYITEERMFCVSDFYFGKPHSCIATTIGQNQQNKAEWYVYNLNVDTESLRFLAATQLSARLAASPKPVRRLKSNAAPMLFSVEDAPEMCKNSEHGLKELERRAVMLQSDAALRERLISAFEAEAEEYPPSPHIEQQIYNGFIEKPDEKLMEEFHEAAWAKRYAIVEKFKDPRLKEIGTRLIHLERPDLLGKATCRKYDLAAAKRLLGQGEDISWLTIPQALLELEGMKATATGAELRLLQEHEQYLRKRHKQALMDVK